MNAASLQTEFTWRDTLAYALELADRSDVEPDPAKRDDLIRRALRTYQAARALRSAEARR